jgi:hypothetical protein
MCAMIAALHPHVRVIVPLTTFAGALHFAQVYVITTP